MDLCICPLGFRSARERASLRTLYERMRCVQRARHARIKSKGGKKEKSLKAHQKGI